MEFFNKSGIARRIMIQVFKMCKKVLLSKKIKIKTFPTLGGISSRVDFSSQRQTF